MLFFLVGLVLFLLASRSKRPAHQMEGEINLCRPGRVVAFTSLCSSIQKRRLRLSHSETPTLPSVARRSLIEKERKKKVIETSSPRVEKGGRGSRPHKSKSLRQCFSSKHRTLNTSACLANVQHLGTAWLQASSSMQDQLVHSSLVAGSHSWQTCSHACQHLRGLVAVVY